MKRLFLFGTMCLAALAISAVISCTKETESNNGNSSGGYGLNNDNDEYVDLGLPSGTRWKKQNETNTSDAEYDFYTYNEAVTAFGNRLPSKAQWEELKGLCQWIWSGSSYNVVGPNGNSIFLPAKGYRDCEGNVNGVDSGGDYWSSTTNGSDGAWGMLFNPGSIYMNSYTLCFGNSVRLVKN